MLSELFQGNPSGQKNLPEPLSVEQIDGLIAEAIKETHATSAKEMGSVMKWLTPKTMGRADNRVVSQKVKALLGG